jgi:hypothetical protein
MFKPQNITDDIFLVQILGHELLDFWGLTRRFYGHYLLLASTP